MKHYLLTLTALMLLGITSAYGQVRLSDMEFGSTDSIQKSTIRYFSPGKGGYNRVWDLSSRLVSKKTSQVLFMKDSTGLVSVIEPGKIKYYLPTRDSLVLTGSESSLEKREYANHKFSKKFPLEISDSTTKSFLCDGIYCGNHSFREVGTTNVKIDGIGSIVLAENDTVRNVTRAHTIDSYSVCMDIDVAALDTAKQTQVIDEHYEWYLPYSEYPIIELSTSTTYLDMEAIGTTRRACCNLPEYETERYVTLVDDWDEDEPDDFLDEDTSDPDIIHYEIGVNGKLVNITYDLDADATINIIVANHMGIIYKHTEWTQSAGHGYSAQIDCSGLRSGTYLLYINVNGKIYSEKVTL